MRLYFSIADAEKSSREKDASTYTSPVSEPERIVPVIVYVDSVTPTDVFSKLSY